MELIHVKFGKQLRNLLVLYVVTAYTIDYGSTIYGTSLGIREASGLMGILMSEFGLFAIPVAILIVASLFLFIASTYGKSPRYVAVLLVMIAASETFVVTSNLISIHNQLVNLGQILII